MTEQQTQQQIRLALSKGPTRLWRNNTGCLKDQQGRPVRFGLCEGSADLIGYTTVEVTPEMVGQRIAVFTAVEVKSPTGRATPAQAAFLDHVRQAGGRAGIARSVTEAVRITTATVAQPQ
jgi:VRR-NUC domain.